MDHHRRPAVAALALLTLLAVPVLHAKPSATLTWESRSAAAQSHLTLREEGGEIVLIDDATKRVVASAPASDTTRVVVRGADGAHDDTLTVDLSHGLRLAEGIDYDGGAGGFDTLVLTGGSTAAQSIRQLSPSAGIIDVAGLTIRYDNLEPVNDTGSTTNYTFTATTGGEEINVVDGPVVGGTQTTQINSGASGTFELVNFANKTNVIVDTNGGSDLVTVNNPNPAVGLATLTVQGGALAESFRVTPSATIPYTINGGGPLPPGTGDVLIVPLAGTTGQALSIASDATGLQGQFTFTNRQPVTFSQVETINPSDLFITKNGPGTVTAGGNVVYTINVQNLGPNDAANISLSDNLAPSFTFVSIAQTAGPTFTCGVAPGATGTLTCTTPVLLNGDTATLQLTVRASSGLTAGSTVSNSANVTSGTSELAPSDNSATANATVTATADVAVTKSGPATITPSTAMTYTINVTNNGPSDAANVTLTDTLPPSTTFALMSQSGGATFTCTTPAVGATGTITCNAATLLSGATTTFTLHVTTGATLPPTMSNTATVSTTTTDPSTANDTSTATTTSTAAADLAIAKVAGAPTVSAGGTITYTITVHNNGPSTATNVAVADALPAGTTFSSASSTQGSCTGTTTVTCSVGTMTSGSTVTVTLAINAPPTGSVSNTATVSATEADPNPANNSSTAVVTITPAPPAPVPALSEWMLVLLGALLALAAATKLR